MRKKTEQKGTFRITRSGNAAKEKRVAFSAPYILRLCHGWTQKEVAERAGLTQPDICEMESYEPYGYKEKYIRLAKIYNVSLDVLLTNDFSGICEGDLHLPRQEYTEATGTPEQIFGRLGEEYALKMEKDRLREMWPALEDLVLPFFKIKHLSPGFDILSFDEHARPFALEVKTSPGNCDGFRLTRNEMQKAKTLTEEGDLYVVRLIKGFGERKETVEDIPFSDIQNYYSIAPQTFVFTPITKRVKSISGLAYHRQEQGIKQCEFAGLLGIAPHELSLYENGRRMVPVSVLIAARNLLGVSIDQLVEEYVV